jgi:YHS domain-containing protein
VRFALTKEVIPMEKCPVCGMNVDKKQAPTSEYQDRTYYFCSEECKEKFDENPQEYMTRRTG